GTVGPVVTIASSRCVSSPVRHAACRALRGRRRAAGTARRSGDGRRTGQDGRRRSGAGRDQAPGRVPTGEALSNPGSAVAPARTSGAHGRGRATCTSPEGARVAPTPVRRRRTDGQIGWIARSCTMHAHLRKAYERHAGRIALLATGAIAPLGAEADPVRRRRI